MNRTYHRRRFLGQVVAAAGAIGVPLPIASSVLGKDAAVAPSNKITLGCIGVGGMGTGNMRNFLSLEDCRVVAVCDAYENRRQKAKDLVDAEYGDKGCAAYRDYRELLRWVHHQLGRASPGHRQLGLPGDRQRSV